MLRRLSFYFVCLLLLSTLVTAFHHHDDGADHADCPVCVAHHQQSDTGRTLPVISTEQNMTETAYLRPSHAVITQTVFSPANNRAPPV
jgi:hypothetical protein